MGALHGEHVLLGASFAPSETSGLLRVSSYAHESAEGAGAVLADLTGAAYLLASGPDAAVFAGSAFAGRRLAVGEVALEAALNGTGGLVSVPLLVRTGDTEHVIVDAGGRADSLAAWLAFLAGARAQDDRAAFPELELADASDMLVPLLLAGPEASHVLSDYVGDKNDLPAPGTVRQLKLDAIPAVVAHVAAPFAPPAYLVLVPAGAARILWRSFLSFTEVAPVGLEWVAERVSELCPWGEALGRAEARCSRDELEAWGVVRDADDFVGARALV